MDLQSRQAERQVQKKCVINILYTLLIILKACTGSYRTNHCIYSSPNWSGIHVYHIGIHTTLVYIYMYHIVIHGIPDVKMTCIYSEMYYKSFDKTNFLKNVIWLQRT